MSNLLPLKEIERIKFLYQKRFLVIVFRSVVVLSVVASVFLFPSYLFSKNEESDLISKKNLLESRETSEMKQSLIATIYDTNDRLNVFNNDYLISPIVSSFINPILKSRIDSIHVTNLSYSTGVNTKTAKVQITGLANSREAILSFGDNLKKQPEIVSVDIPISNFIKENNMPFFVNLIVSIK